MNVEDREINGFTIDQFNQYGLEVGKTQGICPCVLTIGNLVTRKLSAHLTTGNVVLAPVITVILVFSFILINARVQAKRSILDLMSLPT